MMKNSILEYKGYHTKIIFDAETFTLRGKIEGINDLVNFESSNVEDIEKEFRDAVDDYLDFCEQVGKEPEKEYKGTFNIRISPELHKKISLKASKLGISLNATVEKAIAGYLDENNHTTTQEKTVLILPTEMMQKNYSMKTPYSIDGEYNPKLLGNNLTMYYQES